MSEINASNFKKEHGDLAPDLVGVTEFQSPYFFVPPSGTTAERPEDCEPGTLRFNTDIGSLEIFRGDTIGWEQIQRRDNQYLGGGTGSNTGTGTRAIAFGGGAPSATNVIDFITIEVLGNAQDFGDLAHNESSMAAPSDDTRILCVGGSSNHPGQINTIEKMTIASTGNASDFGDAISACTHNPYGGGDRTRAVYGGGGSPSNVNTLEYITIQSEGNGVDFGDLTAIGQFRRGNAGSTTRGIVFGNYAPGGDSHSNHNIIDFFTFSTTGNAKDFGDLTTTFSDATGSSNSVRALRIGKWPTNDMIDYVTIASRGNAHDFGDLIVGTYHSTSATNSTRAVRIGGNQPAPNSPTNSIEFLTIMTLGDGTDFGDLTTARRGLGGNSNGHGGL